MPIRTFSPGRDDEVAGVGQVVAGNPSAVHPRITAAAAREQPAVAGRRAPYWEARPPPGLGFRLHVNLGRREARLPVLPVADEGRVAAAEARHAQPYGGALAGGVGMLDDVDSRAVVVRLAEEDRGALSSRCRRWARSNRPRSPSRSSSHIRTGRRSSRSRRSPPSRGPTRPRLPRRSASPGCPRAPR